MKSYYRDLSSTSRRAFDPERARALLAEAGYGRGFEVQVMTTQRGLIVLEVIGDLLREEVNVTLIPEVMDVGGYIARRNDGDYDAIMIGSGSDADPDDAIDDWFADGSGFNTYGYNDEIVNRLNLGQKAAVDVNRRRELVFQIGEQMDKTFPGLFLNHRVIQTAYWNDVKGYVWIYGLRQLSTVWLDR